MEERFAELKARLAEIHDLRRAQRDALLGPDRDDAAGRRPPSAARS